MSPCTHASGEHYWVFWESAGAGSTCLRCDMHGPVRLAQAQNRQKTAPTPCRIKMPKLKTHR